MRQLTQTVTVQRLRTAAERRDDPQEAQALTPVRLSAVGMGALARLSACPSRLCL